jgi:carbon monoxide dehydrogenase subunit G
MARLHESLDTSLPADAAFAFIADFANSSQWDPGVAWAKPLTQGPVQVGSVYQLGVRMGSRVTPMEYRITTLEPGRRVVLEGKGSGVEATDDIRFSPIATGTRIDYSADIRLRGWLRLVAPFAGGAFAAIARNARAGMLKTLDEMAQLARAEARA